MYTVHSSSDTVQTVVIVTRHRYELNDCLTISIVSWFIFTFDRLNVPVCTVGHCDALEQSWQDTVAVAISDRGSRYHDDIVTHHDCAVTHLYISSLTFCLIKGTILNRKNTIASISIRL